MEFLVISVIVIVALALIFKRVSDKKKASKAEPTASKSASNSQYSSDNAPVEPSADKKYTSHSKK